MPRGARCHLRPPQPSGVPGSALLRALQSPQSLPVRCEGLLPDQFSLLVDLYVTTFVALSGDLRRSLSPCLAPSIALGTTAIVVVACGGQSDFE